jgi:protein pelota
MLKNEPARAFYGPKHVMAACEAEAIETLLISDKLFRASNVAERKKVPV